MFIYAGIGSRKAPEQILEYMKKLAIGFAEQGCTLRSGGAEGSDKAFENGVLLRRGRIELYLPWPGYVKPVRQNNVILSVPAPGAYDLAKLSCDNWDERKNSHKSLLARNAHILLGVELNNPVDVVFYYNCGSGGTNHTLSMAKKLDIPTINVEDRKMVKLVIGGKHGP